MILAPTPISSDRFTFDPLTLVLVIEASDLGVPLGRVYDDACDVGLTVVSSRTGREVVFAVDHQIRDREHDLVATVLKPVRGNDGLPLSVHILND